MSEFWLQLFSNRPELILMGMLLAILAMMLMSLPFIAIFGRKSRFADYEFILKRLLSDPEVAKQAKENPKAIEELLKTVLAAVPEPPPPDPKRRGFLTKISEDITWDVSGLIGVAVTMVLLIMMVSGKKADVPEAITAGWTTILGFYFGRATAKV